MTSIKLFAGTDVGLRDNNEDNFIVCSDLTKDKWMVPADQQEPIPLGQRGCLVVVADGMGGMNAGEVASDIAIKTVQQLFSPSALPAKTVEKPEAVKAYLKKVITQADIQVKKRCKADPSTEGMGSTIVIAWLLDNNVYVGWLGDSRAYSFISSKGIVRLSKDHSYVQKLVDAKMLTEDEAMNHPESNVVVRSLGDTSQKAKPDIIVHPVCEGEIILLCSDGLCGVCKDDEITEILKKNSDDLQSCKEALTTAALQAGGSDNITVALLQLVSVDNKQPLEPQHNKRTSKIWILLCFVAICLLGLIIVLFGKSNEPTEAAVEKISLKLSSATMTHADTITYDVAISPREANQDFYLECDNNNIVIDTLAHKITLKTNVQGSTRIIAIAKSDNAKRDTIQLNLRKIATTAEETSPQNNISIDFRINHSGPLEYGKEYGYTIVVNPKDAIKDGYTIKCSSPAVSIDMEHQLIKVSAELKNNVECIFMLSINKVPSVTKKFKCKLKGNSSTDSDITVSEGKFAETTQ